MRLYAYCVCEPIGEGAIAGVRGVDGGEVREFECGEGLAVVVSELKEEGAVGVTPERVREHSRVIAKVLARTTPLPFRFGTLLREARLVDYLAANAVALRAALARVEGCVEMGVKIMRAASEVEGAAERDDDEAAAAAASSADSSSAEVGRGTAFLLAKRREILGGDAARAAADEAASLLAGRVADVVRESRVGVLPSRGLLVRAAHLVERGRLEEYRERVRGLAAEGAGRLVFLTSGPWPPYGFSDINSA